MAQRKSGTIQSTSWSEKLLTQHEVLLVAPAEIADYLDSHADLAAVVPAVCAQARKDFGEKAELVLSVYHDPEIDDHYLELNVRLPSYDNDFTAQLDRVSEPFDAELAALLDIF